MGLNPAVAVVCANQFAILDVGVVCSKYNGIIFNVNAVDVGVVMVIEVPVNPEPEKILDGAPVVNVFMVQLKIRLV